MFRIRKDFQRPFQNASEQFDILIELSLSNQSESTTFNPENQNLIFQILK